MQPKEIVIGETLLQSEIYCDLIMFKAYNLKYVYCTICIVEPIYIRVLIQR